MVDLSDCRNADSGSNIFHFKKIIPAKNQIHTNLTLSGKVTKGSQIVSDMYTHYFYHIEDGARLEKCETFEEVAEHDVPDIDQILKLNKLLIFRRAV